MVDKQALKTNKIRGGFPRSVLSPLESQLYGRYKSSAKERNHSFELTEWQFLKLIGEQCFYCGKPLEQHIRKYDHKKKNIIHLYYNGIDRLDSDNGYEYDNCVPCCITCNRMKLDLTPEVFFDQIRKIYYRHIRKDKD